MRQTAYFQDLGLMSYKEAWDYQEQLLERNVSVKSAKWRNPSDGEVLTATDTEHYLLFVEHPAVFTLGKSGKEEHVLISNEEREKNHIDFYRINRGGDITFHGPGQIVAYQIFDLEKMYTDIGRFMRSLEEVIIRTLAEYGLAGDRSPGETGVWLDPGARGRERKICAIGIRCSRWITMHGIAFNVNTDLSYFNNIIPCGIVGKQVTSLQKELGRELDVNEVKQKVKRHFQEVFDLDLI